MTYHLRSLSNARLVEYRRLALVARAVRLHLGGPYAKWQVLLDRKDGPGLAAFSRTPEALEFGSWVLARLGTDLRDAREIEAMRDLLRAAVARYPHEVWLRWDLRNACIRANPPAVYEALHHAAAAVTLQPTSSSMYQRLGEVYGRVGDLDGALAAYREAVRLEPLNDGEFGFEYAAILLLSGDQVEYRKVCAALLERSGNPRIRPYHVARACTLAADSVERATLPAERAEGELKRAGKEFWSLTERGALAYRAGRYDEAATLFEQSLKADSKPGRVALNWFWLSLVEHRRGKPAEAQAWLEKATKWLEQYRTGIPAKEDRDLGLHLHDWLEAQILRREAEALLVPRK
jgi:tetratricopeptide (TPR) repeat protein